jgi:hypothetical protein
MVLGCPLRRPVAPLKAQATWNLMPYDSVGPHRELTRRWGVAQEHKNTLLHPHNSDPALAAQRLRRGEIHLLDVSGTQLDAQGLIMLAKGLPDNTTLTKLYMAGALRVQGSTACSEASHH